MKKYLLLLPVLLLALPVSAATYVAKNDATYALPAGQTQSSDIYAGAKQIDLAGTVAADANVAGETVSISGTVNEDLIAAGRTLSISGTVGQDVRAIGQAVTISGKIHGDVLVAGESLSILPGAVIDGDVLFAGKNLSIEGDVKGEVRTLTGAASVTGGKTGSLFVHAQQVTLTNATVSGDVTYAASEELVRDQATVITGKVTRNELPTQEKQTPTNPMESFSVVTLLMALVMTGLTVWLFKAGAEMAVMDAVMRPIKNTAVGVAVLIAIPVVSVVLLITIIGLPLGLLMLFLYAALLIVAKILTGVFVGALIAKVARKEYRVSYLWGAIGVVVLMLVSYIPLVGWIPGWVSFFLMIGVLFRAGEQKVFNRGA